MRGTPINQQTHHPTNATPVASRPSKPPLLANPICVSSQYQSHNICVASRHGPKSRLSSYPPTRGVNQLVVVVDQPVRGPPCLPSHQSTRAGTQLHQSSGPSRVVQGPLANTRSSRDEHHGPPTVSARPRRSWFNDKPKNTDG